eukprot:768137-Hanusia_phi.AAC.15
MKEERQDAENKKKVTLLRVLEEAGEGSHGLSVAPPPQLSLQQVREMKRRAIMHNSPTAKAVLKKVKEMRAMTENFERK